MKKDSWAQYYENTKRKPPSKLLMLALAYVENKNTALDLGAGAFVDSLFLLENGFMVTAVDSSSASQDLAYTLDNPKFNFIYAQFDNFSFSPNAYDLISAQWALPFNPPDTFEQMFTHLKSSLKPRGIFTGHFFGKNDQWNVSGKNMTFHTKEEIIELLSPSEIIQLKEEEKDGTTADGTPKHWHVYYVIAQNVLKP